MQTVPQPWPHFVIDEIILFAATTASSVWVLAGVNQRWLDVVAQSETIPESLALRQYRGMFPATRSDLRMGWAALRRVVALARSLPPLPPTELIPIENCERWRVDCPMFGERLCDGSFANRAARSAPLQCSVCARDVTCRGHDRRGANQQRVAATGGPWIDVDGWARRHVGRFGLLSRVTPRDTYGVILFDVDGTSALTLCRHIRQIGMNPAPDCNVGLASVAYQPSFRYGGGSCAHQYELYPVTLSQLEVPADSVIWRLLPEQHVMFVAIISTDPMNTAVENVVAKTAASFNVGRKISRYTPSKLGAVALTNMLESQCGSETDYGSEEGNSGDSLE
jgi:hypothetical protein